MVPLPPILPKPLTASSAGCFTFAEECGGRGELVSRGDVTVTPLHCMAGSARIQERKDMHTTLRAPTAAFRGTARQPRNEPTNTSY
jgi:hypothetical protein